MRLRYKTDLRNTDERRLTSLAWAALSVSEDVFEWLLLDAGHDDDELSRVSPLPAVIRMMCWKVYADIDVGLIAFSSCSSYPHLHL